MFKSKALIAFEAINREVFKFWTNLSLILILLYYIKLSNYYVRIKSTKL